MFRILSLIDLQSLPVDPGAKIRGKLVRSADLSRRDREHILLALVASWPEGNPQGSQEREDVRDSEVGQEKEEWKGGTAGCRQL